jgi:hypothetical protein
MDLVDQNWQTAKREILKNAYGKVLEISAKYRRIIEILFIEGNWPNLWVWAKFIEMCCFSTEKLGMRGKYKVEELRI